MTKKDLFDWAAENSCIYPDLNRLCEETVDGEVFINLPCEYGIYKEQYYYLDANRTEKIKSAKTIDELLCGNETVELLRNRGNSVAIIENYDTAQNLILDYLTLRTAKAGGFLVQRPSRD